MIHTGWRLAANPLYGNLKPNQQPYRTLVLTRCEAGGVDLESLELIESAVRIYEDSPVLRRPGELPRGVARDFRYIDYTLMEETLKMGGLLLSQLTRYAERGR